MKITVYVIFECVSLAYLAPDKSFRELFKHEEGTNLTSYDGEMLTSLTVWDCFTLAVQVGSTYRRQNHKRL